MHSRFFLFVPILLCVAFIGSLFFVFTEQWIDFSQLEHYNPANATIIYDDQGNEWTRFSIDRREPISLSSCPSYVIEAFLAAEDWYFFSHHGISWRGIFRSILINLYYRRRVQGASTITQQLVKLLFFDNKKTFVRKIKEQLYALILERNFSKELILQTYLNHIYFGCGIYGIEAACQRFWQKSVTDISIDQAALLAGIIRCPSKYCPLINKKLSQKRRNAILRAMTQRGIITESESNRLQKLPVIMVSYEKEMIAPYLREMVRQFLEKNYGKKAIYHDGLRVYTTLNQSLQRLAEREFKKQIKVLQADLAKPVDGGVISFESTTGEIKTLIGGYDFTISSFNRVAQARRQLGSVFKPIIYAAALEQGKQFKDVVIDEPIAILLHGKEWHPSNWDKLFHGKITRAFALLRSNNIATIKTLLETGIENVISLAQHCHLPGPFSPYPSLALGCVDATLLQAAAMFNIFACHGRYVEPYYIRCIKDKWGTKLYTQQEIPEQVIDRRIADKVAKILMQSPKRAYKWFSDQWFAGEAMSKTGTTNDSRTCWYVGATPRLATGVYIGCDDNQSLGKNVYPVRTAFPIWLAIMRATSHEGDHFTFDPSMQERAIHEKTGKLCKPNDIAAISILESL